MPKDDPNVAPTSAQVPEERNLPTENPPVPSDYEDLGATWWCDEGSVTIADGQTVDFPSSGIFFSPPVHGRGVVRNECTFSFDLVSGSVTAVIGVANPSEYNRPMKPYVGVSYPNPTIPLTAGQRVHLIRVDIIDQSSMPSNIGSWEMNPGMSGGNGRAGFPSLAPNVTAVNGPAVITNVQIQSYAVTI